MARLKRPVSFRRPDGTELQRTFKGAGAIRGTEHHWRGLVCEGCGARYRDLRTGLSFREVRKLAKAKEKHGRRSTVLGMWHEIKRTMWEEQHRWCEAAAAGVPA